MWRWDWGGSWIFNVQSSTCTSYLFFALLVFHPDPVWFAWVGQSAVWNGVEDPGVSFLPRLLASPPSILFHLHLLRYRVPFLEPPWASLFLGLCLSYPPDPNRYGAESVHCPAESVMTSLLCCFCLVFFVLIDLRLK